MPVTELILENFKSYGGVQRIGPFQDFTCVIGPNGAGTWCWYAATATTNNNTVTAVIIL